MQFDGRILEREEIDRLARQALDGCEYSLPRLVEGHLRMFYKMAQKYTKILDVDEVVAIMVENVTEKFPVKFDPNRGNFTKYARWYAIAGIQWYLRFRLRVIHFPAREDDKIVSFEQWTEIEDDDGDIDAVIHEPKVENGLDDFISEEHRQHLRRFVRSKISRLDPESREVLRLRFGIGKNGKDTGELTYKEVGDRIGYSHEWARKMVNRALEKLTPYLQNGRD